MSVTLICNNVSIVDTYATNLINLITSKNVPVNVLSNSNFDKSTSAPHEQLQIPENNLIHHPKLATFWIIKDRSQESLTAFHKVKNGQLLVFVCKDAENKFSIDHPLPFLSIFCLTLNYDSIPPQTKKVIGCFQILVATGFNSKSKLNAAFPDKVIATIFPDFIMPERIRETLEYRKILNIRPDKYIFFIDVNEYIEIKSVDSIVRAYAKLIDESPEFKRDTLLLINALPTIQLQNILSLESFNPDNVNVFVPYYSAGLNHNHVLLESLIGSCNVYLHLVSGGDFDPHAFLAQQLGKLMIHGNVGHEREYFPYALQTRDHQSYFEGIGQGFIKIPRISEIQSALSSAFDKRTMLVPGEKIRHTLHKFVERNNRFESQWSDLLSSVSLRSRK